MRKVSPPAQTVAVRSARHMYRDEATDGCAWPVRNFILTRAHSKSTGWSTSTRQGSQQVRVVFLDALLAVAQLLDALAGVQHGGVVAAAEGIADLRQTVAGELLGERHGDLPRARHRAAAALGPQVRHAHPVVVRHGLLDVLDGDELRLQRQQVL